MENEMKVEELFYTDAPDKVRGVSVTIDGINVKLGIRDMDGVKHRAPIVAFVDDDRPGMSDIAADLAWRRTHGEPLKGKALVRALARAGQAILAADVDSVFLRKAKMLSGVEKTRYSRKAGCPMCPCSPGYLAYTGDGPMVYAGIYTNRIRVYVKKVA